MLEIVHPYACIFKELFVLYELFEHHRNVLGAAILSVFWKSRAIDERSIGHSPFRRAVVHFRNERIDAAIEIFGNRNARIVRGRYHNALQQLVKSVIRICVQKRLRSAHRRGVFGRRHHGIERYFALFDFVETKPERHDLDHARYRQMIGHVFFKYDRARIAIHQKRGARSCRKLQFCGLGIGARDRGHKRQKRRERYRKRSYAFLESFFHFSSVPRKII